MIDLVVGNTELVLIAGYSIHGGVGETDIGQKGAVDPKRLILNSVHRADAYAIRRDHVHPLLHLWSIYGQGNFLSTTVLKHPHYSVDASAQTPVATRFAGILSTTRSSDTCSTASNGT